MKKLIVFSTDDHETMISLIKNSLYEVNSLEGSHTKNQIYNKLTEVLILLTKEYRS